MSRAVRVTTEVAAVDRSFDYLVPDAMAMPGLGDRVRMNFNGRSVRGWVTGTNVVSERELKPVAKLLGFGPPPELVALLEWAAWRWAAPLSRFLLAATPGRLVHTLPTAPMKAPLSMPITEHFAPGVHQVSPARDPLAIILSAYEQTREMPGSLLVLVPTEGWAQRLRGRLEQRGLPVACGDDQWDRMRATWPVIIGTRGDALAPTSRLAGVVIVDADDDAFTSESSPTWNALVMAHERVTRDGGLLWATSVLPSPQLLALGDLHTSDHTPWPHIEVVDRRNRDPHEGVLAEPALRQAHRALSQGDGVAVAVILQRLGTGRLLSCRSCGELARCAVCHQPEQEVDGMLSCAERHNIRENFCQLCGATNLRKVQTGVTTLARDISLQLSQPVTEVTASTATDPTTRVVVGTEAVFSRLRRCPVVIFVDFDQYILAPRASAHRQAVSAVTRAARLVVASGDAAGTVIVQTRRSDALITALMSGEVSAIRDEDVVTAEVLGLPPYGASAEISGDGAEGFVASVPMAGLRRSESMGTVTLHAASVDALCNALAQATRTGDRLRLAVS